MIHDSFLSASSPLVERHKWFFSLLYDCLTFKRGDYSAVLFVSYSVFIWILAKIRWTLISQISLMAFMLSLADLTLPFLQDLLGANVLSSYDEEENVRNLCDELNSALHKVSLLVGFVDAGQASFRGTYLIAFFLLMYIGRVNNYLLAWFACLLTHFMFASRTVLGDIPEIVPSQFTSAVRSRMSSVKDFVSKMTGSPTASPIPSPAPDYGTEMDVFSPSRAASGAGPSAFEGVPPSSTSGAQSAFPGGESKSFKSKRSIGTQATDRRDQASQTDQTMQSPLDKFPSRSDEDKDDT